MQKVGVVDDAEDAKAETLLEKNFWSPRYVEQFGKQKVTFLKSESAKQFAKQLWDAGGTFNDDEQAMYGVFRQLKTKVQVSQLAKVFFNMYGQDLAQYLANHLNNDELAIIYGITNKLKAK